MCKRARAIAIATFVCAHTATATPATPATPAAPAAGALQQSALQNCLTKLRHTPDFKSIRSHTWQAHAQSLEPDASVLSLLDHQPEFTVPVWDYLAVLVDDERVKDGRAAYAKWQPILRKIEGRYTVPAELIVSVWGVESNFGQVIGGRSLLTSLGTLSCFGRRQTYFRTEFAAALRIVQEGHVSPAKLTGSWAGAFGQTQFMPSTFLRTAVDFDGDGRRDIVDSVPDALASTARFLKAAGYRSGEPWGIEVRLPSDITLVGNRKFRKSMTNWRQLGLALPGGNKLPGTMENAGLLMPAGAGGPAFLVGRNFNALYSYNASENYALAIGLLADLISAPTATPGFSTPWPTDDPGLSRAEIRELQEILLRRGWEIGRPDGLLGIKSREAIKTEQIKLGVKADGRAGQKLLKALKQ